MGNIVTHLAGNLLAVCWRQVDMYILKNMHDTSAESNFIDQSGHATKPYRTEDYSAQTGFVDKSDRMVNSYRMNLKTLKLINKLLFHLTDMANLNAFHIHKSCGDQMTPGFFGRFSFAL